MPLRFRRLAPALALVALTGCDTNSSTDVLRELDGSYDVVELTFDPDPNALDEVDVAARLRPAGTRFRIYGEDGDVLFESQFDDGSGARATRMTATASGSRVTFTAVEASDEEELADLLLPPSFTLTFDRESPDELEGEVFQSSVDLEAFDPEEYDGLPPVDGRLRVRLDPASDD